MERYARWAGDLAGLAVVLILAFGVCISVNALAAWILFGAAMLCGVGAGVMLAAFDSSY